MAVMYYSKLSYGNWQLVLSADWYLTVFVSCLFYFPAKKKEKKKKVSPKTILTLISH